MPMLIMMNNSRNGGDLFYKSQQFDEQPLRELKNLEHEGNMMKHLIELNTKENRDKKRVQRPKMNLRRNFSIMTEEALVQ